MVYSNNASPNPPRDGVSPNPMSHVMCKIDHRSARSDNSVSRAAGSGSNRHRLLMVCVGHHGTVAVEVEEAGLQSGGDEVGEAGNSC
jgi:hypothetical protein